MNPGFDDRVATAAKGKDPCPHLQFPGPRVARPRPVSRTRPDAEETLRLVLARLDDMKAEDIITIDLRGKTSIGDYMVVASGRSQRHVGSVADSVIEGFAQVRHCDARRGRAALRLGADRRQRRHRSRVPAGGAHLLQSRKDVDARPRRDEADELTRGGPWRAISARAFVSARLKERDDAARAEPVPGFHRNRTKQSGPSSIEPISTSGRQITDAAILAGLI